MSTVKADCLPKNADAESILAQTLVRECNELHAIANHQTGRRTTSGENGPWRWRESCNQTIIMPCDIPQYELILQTNRIADPSDILRVRIMRKLPTGWTFDRIESILVDGAPCQPTNHSLSRTVDLAFNRIAAGSIIAVRYHLRLAFNAEPTDAAPGQTTLQSAWVQRNRRWIMQRGHQSLSGTRIASPQSVETVATV